MTNQVFEQIREEIALVELEMSINSYSGASVTRPKPGVQKQRNLKNTIWERTLARLKKELNRLENQPAVPPPTDEMVIDELKQELERERLP